jgi:hypothetical protein
MDRYLAKRAWESQETDRLPPGHPLRHDRDNLDAPLPGDPGAHGPFDARARTWSSRLWARLHPAALGAVAVGLAGVGAGALLAWSRSARNNWRK